MAPMRGDFRLVGVKFNPFKGDDCVHIAVGAAGLVLAVDGDGDVDDCFGVQLPSAIMASVDFSRGFLSVS